MRYGEGREVIVETAEDASSLRKLLVIGVVLSTVALLLVG
jgi:hypothetical protein